MDKRKAWKYSNQKEQIINQETSNTMFLLKRFFKLG